MEVETLKTIGTVVGIITPIVILVAWAVRVESRASQNHSDIRDIEKEQAQQNVRIEKNAMAVSSLDTLKTDIEWIKSTLQRLLDKLDK